MKIMKIDNTTASILKLSFDSKGYGVTFYVLDYLEIIPGFSGLTGKK